VTPRRIVLAYGIVTLVGWLLVAVGVTDSPGTTYLIVDAALDSLIFVGLFDTLATGLAIRGRAYGAR
jgi:hypothetical protein